MGYPYQYEMPWSMISPLQQLLKNLVSRSHFQLSKQIKIWVKVQSNSGFMAFFQKKFCGGFNPSQGLHASTETFYLNSICLKHALKNGPFL